MYFQEITCPAKINLHLEVGEIFCDQRNGRSYHKVCTLMQAVWMAKTDQLRLEYSKETVDKAESVNIRLKAEPEPCPLEENLVYRATLRYLQQQRGKHWPKYLNFELVKHIPKEAGLGGGSSNAAAALKLLNQCLPPYYGLASLHPKTLHEIAADLGSDLPFFLQNFTHNSGLAWGIERGETIVPLADHLAQQLLAWQHKCQLWLVKPIGVACPTQPMFRTLDLHILKELSSHKQLEKQWQQNWKQVQNLGDAKQVMANDFFAIIQENTQNIKTWKVLATLQEYLYSLAASWVALSGSGAAFFAWFPAHTEKTKIEHQLANFEVPLEFHQANVC